MLNSDPQKPCLLIAIQKGAQSDFKQELVKLLKAEYGSKYTVNVKQVKKYRDLEKEQYNALVVMDMLKAWLWMNKGLKDIIKKSDANKTVFFLSTGEPDWKWKGAKVKMVTSATNRKVKPEVVFAKLKQQLDPILKH